MRFKAKENGHTKNLHSSANPTVSLLFLIELHLPMVSVIIALLKETQFD